MKVKLKEKGEAVLLFLVFFIWYCFWQSKSIYGGDSGDLVTAAWVWGIPHPPGYPLYTLLASVLSHNLLFFTPAWRVGLISSFSSAAALAIFYLLSFKISKNKLTSLLGTLTLAFIYPFWLYSEVAEVFALNNLFIILLTYLFINIPYNKINKENLIKASWFILVLGLSLAHHHTIVLLIPGFLYLIIKNKKNYHFQVKQWLLLFLPVVAGALFYLYPLITCRKTPLVCWDEPTNLKNLFQLIFRQDYGTFLSNSALGQDPMLRLVSLASGLKMILLDFKLPGVVLMAVGLHYLYKKQKKVFSLVAINLLVACFFLFYASYVLVSDFMVGTFERFLLFPYLFLCLLLGWGAFWLLEQVEIYCQKLKLHSFSQKFFITGLKILLFLIPISFLMINFPKISLLRNDLTPEKMGQDFLRSLPEKSVLIVSSDTTVFDLEYVRYVLDFRPDVIVLAYPLLPAQYYRNIISKHFPELKLPGEMEQGKFLKELIFTNKDQYNFFVDMNTFPPEEDWLPFGLGWQYLPKDNQPASDLVVNNNQQLWSQFSDPLSGNQKRYDNLFLADVLRVYHQGRINYGNWLLKNNFLAEAEENFAEAIKLDPNSEEGYVGQGVVSLERKACEQAKGFFEKALQINNQNPLTLGYLRKTELECFQNESEAKKYEEQCVQIQQQKGIPLQELSE